MKMSSNAEVWADRNREGRRQASELIDKMMETKNPVLLGWKVQAMIKEGKPDGFEIGFAQEIAERLIFNSANGDLSDGQTVD